MPIAGAAYRDGVAYIDGALCVTPVGNAAITGGTIQVDSGAEATPSVSFASDPTTGFSRGGAGDWRLSAAGVYSLRVIASGIVLPSASSVSWGSSGVVSIDTALARIGAGSAGMTSGRWSVKQGAAVASANDLTLGVDGNRFQISGTTQINRILNTGWQGGSIITLHFQGAVTVSHNATSGSSFQGIMLEGGANFSAAANDQLTLQYDVTSAKWHEIARVSSGSTYTPTITGIANAAATSPTAFQYVRVGNVVTVSGGMTIDPTSASTSTRIGISLPIASNFAIPGNLAGYGSSMLSATVPGPGGPIFGDATNDRAEYCFTSDGTAANISHYFHFTYLVI